MSYIKLFTMKLMKWFFEVNVLLIGLIGRIIFPFKFSLFFQFFFSKIYTNWIASQFLEFGRGSYVKFRINLVGENCIKVGENVKIGKRSTLSAWEKHGNYEYSPEVKIGNNVEIGDDAHISSSNKIVIGDNVLIGKNVTIIDNSHGKTDLESLKLPPSKRRIYSSGPIFIERNVWIGDKATILANVTIGENSIIGANAVVTHDIPPNCIVGGVPAKIIKYINK